MMGDSSLDLKPGGTEMEPATGKWPSPSLVLIVPFITVKRFTWSGLSMPYSYLYNKLT